MNGSIKDFKVDLDNFFVGENHGVDMVFALRVRFANYSLETSFSGISEINEKYGKKYSYLISSDKDSTEMLMFTFCPFQHDDCGIISMYYIKKDKVYIFTSENGNSEIRMKHFRGEIGTNMMLASILARQGCIPSTCVPVSEGVGVDIINYMRKFS